FLRRQKARLLRVSGTPADGMPLLLPLLSFKPDVVHVLNGQQYELYRRAVASVNAKLVVSFRGYETTVRPYEDSDWVHKLRQIYEHADGLHFVSEYLKGEGLRLGAPMEKCVVIRRSVDLDFFSPIDRDQRNGLNILSVGRFTWQKGFTTLLESIALLQGRGILAALTLVGAGAEESLLKAKVLELGLQNV